MASTSKSVLIHGPMLRWVRDRSGFRVTDLAERVDCLPQTISNIEAGRKNPSPVLLAKICQALAVPVADFVVRPCSHESSRVAA